MKATSDLVPCTAVSVLIPPRLRQLHELPGPQKWPIFGNALQIRNSRFHQKLEQWSREFGDYFCVQLGERKTLVVADHRMIGKILRDRPHDFGRTSRLDETWRELGLKVGLFGANGQVWQRQRRMVMAGFDPAHVKAYFPALLAVAGRLRSRWRRSLGSNIDVQADLMRYTVDSITGLAFGVEINTLEQGDNVIQQHLDKIFPAVYRRNMATFRHWRYVRLPADRALERSVAEVNVAISRFIQAGRQRLHHYPHLSEHPSNLLEAMLNATNQSGSGMTDDDVAGNVLTMLLAGEDTTANTLAWLIDLLWMNPLALARVQGEVRGVLRTAVDAGSDARERGDAGGVSMTMEQLNQMDYLDACINEVMRLKPVAPMLTLETHKDVVIGDVLVPPATQIYALMRRDGLDDHWMLHAAEFDPQRWMKPDSSGVAAAGSASSVKRISMPFGAGPRICPGRYLALLEIKIAMAMLLNEFDMTDVSTPDGREAEEYLAFTMAPLGLTMRLREAC